MIERSIVIGADKSRAPSLRELAATQTNIDGSLLAGLPGASPVIEYMGLRLGRKVIIADIAKIHPGKPAKCTCRGTGAIRYTRKGQQYDAPCMRALTEFNKIFDGRFANDARGEARWVVGRSSEEQPVLVGE